MKKLILLTAVLVASNFALAQNAFTKYVYSDTEYLLEERTPAGILVQTTKGDHSFKTMKSYYPCGKLQAVGYIAGNTKVGRWVFYSETGEVSLVLTYRNNRVVRYDKRLSPPTNLIATR
jgi:antitoxin component YwqK of YwqJK toxin-antitoxin module